MSEINTHHLRIDFGKHDGELWTRVPRGYLEWITNEPDMAPERKAIAEAELKRRGTGVPRIQLTAHAIDRASRRYLKKFIAYMDDGGEDGFHTWLMRQAYEAYQTVADDPEGDRSRHNGMQFVFRRGDRFPVVKTVM